MQTNIYRQMTSLFLGTCPDNERNVFDVQYRGKVVSSVRSCTVHTPCLLLLFISAYMCVWTLWAGLWLLENRGGWSTESPGFLTAIRISVEYYTPVREGCCIWGCLVCKIKSSGVGTMRWINFIYNSYVSLCLLVLLSAPCCWWVYIHVVGLISFKYTLTVDFLF
jgi:hypothetical protein